MTKNAKSVEDTPRVFCASLATETNTFSPLRTDFSDFEQGLYAPPGHHPDSPTLCSAVFPALRAQAAAGNISLIEGTAAWAEPGGLINQTAWTRLRDEVLAQLRDAMPIRAALFGLHGAMITEKCLDPEGELIERARDIVGPQVAIGATFDPHSHLSARRAEHADILIAFKEFPHTDFIEAGQICASLTLKTARGEIKPTISVQDARMIDMLPTHREPMRSFVDKLRQLEAAGEALSVSVIHGFMAGDSPDLGAKVIVITDNRPEEGAALARKLADELFSFRGTTRAELLKPRDALERAANAKGGPTVIADVWDNPGGGVAGDSTILLKHALDMQLNNIALGALWDPMAARLCFAAGQGAKINLRFGGKTSAHAGNPIDAQVTVTQLRRNIIQKFEDAQMQLGDCAAIQINGLDVVLSSRRAQTFSPDVFAKMGINPIHKKILIVKSSNHFRSAFAPIASNILYAAIDGLYPSDPRKTHYKNLTRPLWPIVENPHAQSLK
ncbi:MAG: M81 family metallopeptidase [Alphaproteobacteria bacterium]